MRGCKEAAATWAETHARWDAQQTHMALLKRVPWGGGGAGAEDPSCPGGCAGGDGASYGDHTGGHI